MADPQDELKRQMQTAIGDAAKSALLGGDEASRQQRKRYLAIAGVVGGGLGLLLLWSFVTKIGFYLLVLLFAAALGGGAYYLLKGKYEQWQQDRLAARATQDEARTEVDKRKALEAELEALKRKSR